MALAAEALVPGAEPKCPGSVSRAAVNGYAFHAKFASLDLPKRTRERAYNEAGRILRYADGTLYERLVVIGRRDGRLIADDFGHPPVEHRAGFTKTENDAIVAYGQQVVYIHNHPANGLVSWVDIRTANRPEVAMNIAVCHDGTLYVVSSDYAHLDTAYFTIVAELKSYFPGIQDPAMIESMAVQRLIKANERSGGKWLTVTRL